VCLLYFASKKKNLLEEEIEKQNHKLDENSTKIKELGFVNVSLSTIDSTTAETSEKIHSDIADIAG
jgi:hypothetical protein